MCGRRLKTFLVSLVLVLLLSVSQSSLCCYAEVRLTDEEAKELMNEIQLSKKELNQVKTELTEAKQELNDVKNTYSEQKKSYEMQLEEAEKENQIMADCLIVTATTSIILLIVLLL